MNFQTHILSSHPHGQAVRNILAAAVNAVEPGGAVQRFLKRHDRALVIDGQEIPLEGETRVIGLGKAAYAMSLSAAQILADQNPTGLLIPKHTPTGEIRGFSICPGGHPVPDQNSLRAGQMALRMTDGLREKDLLLCLISGGGSALMSAPINGVTLEDLRALTAVLLDCGARIDEINTLRRRLDRLKGGGLARSAHPARVVSLILSDVIDSPLEAIASGPTVPDPATRGQALQVLDTYHLRPRLPAALIHALETAPETPKPGAPLFERVKNVLIGSNQAALQAALESARLEGFHTASLGSAWQGEARETARKLIAEARKTNLERPFCLAAGGETTVTLRGKGQGGRNQELALSAALALDGSPNLMLISLATDGEDGPTDAAGAVTDGQTLKRAAALGLDARAYLDDNNAYAFFAALGDLLKPGPTGTNVNDLVFLFGF